MSIDLTEDEWMRLWSAEVGEAKAILKYRFEPVFQKAGIGEKQAEEILDAVLEILRKFAAKGILYFHSW
jgi:hypothetical protein